MTMRPVRFVHEVDINPKVLAALRKAKLRLLKDVLQMSVSDMERLTKLPAAEIHYLHKAVAAAICPFPPVTALQMSLGDCPFPTQTQRLSLGCPVLNSWLKGGLPTLGVIEIAGESASGKTQICLQLSLSVQYPPAYGGLGAGVVYVCTEDAFPARRLHQLISSQPQVRVDVPSDVITTIPFGNQVYVEHVADVDSLWRCITHRLPLLIARRSVRLVVIDSVAALFRCEFSCSMAARKAKLLQNFGNLLHQISHKHNSPIVCVNQVTCRMDDIGGGPTSICLASQRIIPSLGTAWSNMLLMRLLASREEVKAILDTEHNPQCAVEHSNCTFTLQTQRTLEVLFAPHLPHSLCHYVIKAEGVYGVRESDNTDIARV
uniref:DNA repair protein XRCC3-like isoform X1 n=1 Tax=Myxine glutinosa TaxID=7769 RepID=UPI00358FA311